MSLETNNYSNESNTQVIPETNKSNNKLLIGLLILSLIGNAYLLYQTNKLDKGNTVLIDENTNLNEAKNQLQSEYDASLARLDELTGKNAALDEMIQEKDSELAKLKSEIKTLLTKKNATVADLKKAQALISTLNGKVKTYEERISELETANQQLSTNNQTLSNAKDSIESAANQLKKLGSVLHISNIKMEPINLKRNGEKEVETSKAKRVDVLRLVFDIDENRIAESGDNDIHIQIISPSGSLLSNAAFGSGVSTDADGNTLNYTVAKRINLEKGQKMSNVSVDWKQESQFEKGDYIINFYNLGYKVGTGSVKLK
jgi:myosin heavy subunit